MSSNHNNPTQAMRPAGRDRIISIDWSLLYRRARRRVGQLFNSAKHKAAQTEYSPPQWLTRFRLTWFRLGLIALFLYVFTQKQIDFNLSVGKDGLYAGGTPTEQLVVATSAATTTSQLSILPIGGNSSTTAAPAPTPAANWSVQQLDRSTVEAYVSRFERVARTEAEKYGIPAAGKMAMAIRESGGGSNPVTRENNNHFGDATPNGYYPNAWTNWRSHSEYLKNEFPQLITEGSNLEGWLSSLERSRYSTNSNYAAELRSIIETYNLSRL